MDLYKVVIAPRALEQLEGYIDYIQHTLLNEQAAESVWRDALETSKALEESAASLALCDHPALRTLGYRPMFFLNHRYVMLYRIDGSRACVDAINTNP